MQVWSGNGMNATDWDGHIACDKNHQAKAAQTDKAVAGLLTDLKSRGLLDIDAGDLGRGIRPQSRPRTAARADRKGATTIRTASRSGWPAAA